MVSTSLKTEQAAQGREVEWVPRKPFVTIDAQDYEVVEMLEAPDGDGVYRVRIASGPDRGSELDVRTSQLTKSFWSDRRYVYQATDVNGHTHAVDTILVRKIRPIRYAVKAVPPDGDGPVVKRTVPESKIVHRASPQWSNFARTVRISGVFGRAYVNSIIVAFLVTFGQVFTSSLAAYAFARLEFPGRDKIFLAYLATMMIPGAVTMIPLFVVLKAMPAALNAIFHTAWFDSQLLFTLSHVGATYETYVGRPLGLDSFFALVVPRLFSAYGTFMLRQFFMTLPRDLEDAAKIDGCSLFGIYRNVILPLSKPALAALTIFTFIGSWRDFLWPMVVTSSPEMQTLPVMLSSFMGVTQTQWELLMAGTLMILGPMVLVFLAGQRYFVSGIQLGAIKG